MGIGNRVGEWPMDNDLTLPQVQAREMTGMAVGGAMVATDGQNAITREAEGGGAAILVSDAMGNGRST